MLKNMKIGKKLIMSFIIVALLASISGMSAIYVIKNINTQYAYALVNYGFSQGDIAKAMLMVSDNNRCVRDIIGFTDQADINTAKNKMEDNKSKYATYEAAVKKTLTSDAEIAQFQKIQAAMTAYQTKRDQVLKLGDTTDPILSAQAQSMAVDELDPLYEELYAEWAALMTMNINTGNALSDEMNQQSRNSMILTIVLVAAAVILSVALGTFISRSISKPIEKCVNRLSLLEQGDLSTPVPEATSNDETGVLLRALGNTVASLKNIITDTDMLMNEMANGNFAVASKAEASYVGEFEGLLAAIKKLNKDLNRTLWGCRNNDFSSLLQQPRFVIPMDIISNI